MTRSVAAVPQEMDITVADSGLRSNVRHLYTIKKCYNCRKDRKKCVQLSGSPKCQRCTSLRHDCGESQASRRAQHGRPQPQSQRATRRAQLIDWQRSIRDDLSVAANENHTSMSSHPSRMSSHSSRMSSHSSGTCTESPPSLSSSTSTSFDAPSRSVTPDQHESPLPQFDRDATPTCDGQSQGTAHSAEHLPGTECAAGLQPSLESSFALEPHKNKNTGENYICAVTEDPQWLVLLELEDPYPRFMHKGSSATVSSFDMAHQAPHHDLNASSIRTRQPVLTLTNIRPSRLRKMDTMEAGLDHRIARLWDTGQVFTATDPDFTIVTRLFAQTYTDLFRLSWTMAEAGNEMIGFARLANGAADVWMNHELAESTRNKAKEAYYRYEYRALLGLLQAHCDLNEKLSRNEVPDMLPLCIATFLYHAAGACMRGSFYVNKMVAVFEEYQKISASFPILFRQRRVPKANDDWDVEMLLANNSNDPGMVFTLKTMVTGVGMVRARLDREEGVF